MSTRHRRKNPFGAGVTCRILEASHTGARKAPNNRRKRHGELRYRDRIHRLWAAIVWIVEEPVAADDRDIPTAAAVNCSGFASGNRPARIAASDGEPRGG